MDISIPLPLTCAARTCHGVSCTVIQNYVMYNDVSLIYNNIKDNGKILLV